MTKKRDCPVGSTSPGPWSLRERLSWVGGQTSIGVEGVELHYTADVYRGGEGVSMMHLLSSNHLRDGITREDTRANAHLIAAAPELLEALSYVTRQAAPHLTEGARRLAENALRRARGAGVEPLLTIRNPEDAPR